MHSSRLTLLALPGLSLAAYTLHSRQTVSCSYDAQANQGDTCSSFSSDWGISVAQLQQLNPGLVCPSNLVAGQDYCVLGSVSSASPTTSTSTTQASVTPTPTPAPTTLTTATSPTSATSASYQPQQSGLTASCNNYYQAQPGDTCGAIESKYGISAEEFDSWNPAINSECSNLFVGYYYCVGVPGATTTSASPTSTTPSNGITTPTPTQAGMTSNCDSFYQVQSGDTCSSIASSHSISLSNFYTWNPAVGSSCADLYLGYYVCVDVIGFSPTSSSPPTTSSSSNTGPSPTQSGIASNCDEYYKVQSGDTCSAIASKYSISLSQFYTWNPAVGSSCADLYLGYYVCVDVTGYTPTPTSTGGGNGVTTPTPYEPGMVGDCDKFYQVQSGDQCGTIAQSQGVTVQEIESWNPKVGSSCQDLWLGDYICVGVM